MRMELRAHVSRNMVDAAHPRRRSCSLYGQVHQSCNTSSASCHASQTEPVYLCKACQHQLVSVSPGARFVVYQDRERSSGLISVALGGPVARRRRTYMTKRSFHNESVLQKAKSCRQVAPRNKRLRASNHSSTKINASSGNLLKSPRLVLAF